MGLPGIRKQNEDKGIKIEENAAFKLDIIQGLTKRELFAAMAMQGMYSCAKQGQYGVEYSGEAVKAADKLIKALEQNDDK